jgi:hypothetical protein
MKNSACIALLFALAMGAVCHGDDSGKTVLARGLFSYQAPPGWQVQDMPQSSFPLATEIPAGPDVGSISGAIETFSGDMPTYITEKLGAIRRTPGHETMQVMEKKSFLTTAGLGGTRVVTAETVEGRPPTERILYFFDGGLGEKILITASCPTAYVARYAPLFDASMKSFTLE